MEHLHWAAQPFTSRVLSCCIIYALAAFLQAGVRGWLLDPKQQLAAYCSHKVSTTQPCCPRQYRVHHLLGLLGSLARRFGCHMPSCRFGRAALLPAAYAGAPCHYSQIRGGILAPGTQKYLALSIAVQHGQVLLLGSSAGLPRTHPGTHMLLPVLVLHLHTACASWVASCCRAVRGGCMRLDRRSHRLSLVV
jgi:hypothetical protein